MLSCCYGVDLRCNDTIAVTRTKPMRHATAPQESCLFPAEQNRRTQNTQPGGPIVHIQAPKDRKHGRRWLNQQATGCSFLGASEPSMEPRGEFDGHHAERLPGPRGRGLRHGRGVHGGDATLDVEFDAWAVGGWRVLGKTA